MNPARLALALACAAALAPLTGCQQKVPEPEAQPGSAAPPAKTAEPAEPADLIKEDIVVGTGVEAKAGDDVKVHYTGRLLKNGVEFDSSVGKAPFDFKIGQGAVIKGWDEGVPGIKVGGKRKLTIPSRLGYGDAGSPPKIPKKATLVFDIELLSVGGAAGADAKATPKKDGVKAEPNQGAKKDPAKTGK